MAREIDMDYFEHYGGPHIPYSKCWHHYSFVDACVEELRNRNMNVKSIAILGAADGSAAVGFIQKDAYKIYGCENFKPMYKQIPAHLQKTIKYDNMERYVNYMPEVDLVFSNSLCYLKSQDEIMLVLKIVRFKTKYFYHEPPILSYPDAYRSIDILNSQWEKLFFNTGYRRIGKSNLWGSPPEGFNEWAGINAVKS